MIYRWCDNYTYHFELLQLLHAVACRQYLFTTFHMANRPFCAGTERLGSTGLSTRITIMAIVTAIPRQANYQLTAEPWWKLWLPCRMTLNVAPQLLLPLQAPVFPKFPSSLWIWNHQGHGVPTAVFDHKYIMIHRFKGNHEKSQPLILILIHAVFFWLTNYKWWPAIAK